MENKMKKPKKKPATTKSKSCKDDKKPMAMLTNRSYSSTDAFKEALASIGKGKPKKK